LKTLASDYTVDEIVDFAVKRGVDPDAARGVIETNWEAWREFTIGEIVAEVCDAVKTWVEFSNAVAFGSRDAGRGDSIKFVMHPCIVNDDGMWKWVTVAVKAPGKLVPGKCFNASAKEWRQRDTAAEPTYEVVLDAVNYSEPYSEDDLYEMALAATNLPCHVTTLDDYRTVAFPAHVTAVLPGKRFKGKGEAPDNVDAWEANGEDGRKGWSFILRVLPSGVESPGYSIEVTANPQTHGSVWLPAVSQAGIKQVLSAQPGERIGVLARKLVDRTVLVVARARGRYTRNEYNGRVSARLTLVALLNAPFDASDIPEGFGPLSTVPGVPPGVYSAQPRAGSPPAAGQGSAPGSPIPGLELAPWEAELVRFFREFGTQFTFTEVVNGGLVANAPPSEAEFERVKRKAQGGA